jgi:hypothetical protein
MGVNGKQRSTVEFYDLSVVSSPRGGGAGADPVAPHSLSEPGFDMCPCGSMVASDAHRLFIFYQSPADILAGHGMTSASPDQPWPGQEWRPSPDAPPIPGDRGPARVAYVFPGTSDPAVQVHEGDDEGLWTPCYSYTVTREGMPFSMWVCRRSHVTDPCDEEFMKDISS